MAQTRALNYHSEQTTWGVGPAFPSSFSHNGTEKAFKMNTISDAGVQLSQAIRQIKLCVPIFFDEGFYPSAGIHAERRNIYWRTIAVLCASIKRARIPQLDILVCTNETPPSDISDILDICGVSFIHPPFSFQPPKALFAAFSGAFYLFDCMNHCRHNFSNDDIFVFIDPDCIVMNNLEIIRHYSHQWPLTGYELEIEKDYKVNGSSRNDLLAFLHTMKDNSILEAPKYFGGELLIVNGEALHAICNIIDRVWTLNTRNFQSGKTTLKTEEHVISIALALYAERVGIGNAIIKRMWTRPSFRNVSSEDRKYSIFHLPSEKRFAFQQLFYLIERDIRNLVNLSDNEFGDLVVKSIRLELSFIEKPLYFVYPLIKSIVSHLK
jgi:hypothetical protein